MQNVFWNSLFALLLILLLAPFVWGCPANAQRKKAPEGKSVSVGAQLKCVGSYCTHHQYFPHELDMIFIAVD